METDPTVVMVDQLLRVGTLTVLQATLTWATYCALTALVVLPWWLRLRRK